MRLTFQRAHGGLDYIQVASEQMARARQQVQSGKRVEKASDDPAAMQRSVEGRGEIRTLETYARTSESAIAKIIAMDTVLTTVVDKLSQAGVATLSARNSTATTQQREAAAQTLEGLRDALVADLNTKVRGAYVFGGGEATTVPYVKVAGAWTYQGDTTPIAVEIGPGQTVEVALDGRALAQGTDATNVLDELEQLIVAVRAGDQAGMSTGTAALDRAFARATRTQSSLGADEQSIAERQQVVSTTRLAIMTRVSKDEDADLAMAISEMTRAETAYRAALGAVGTATRASLLDYLR
jgi:flagellar hook-associated protein 3 FlgL